MVARCPDRWGSHGRLAGADESRFRLLPDTLSHLHDYLRCLCHPADLPAVDLHLLADRPAGRLVLALQACSGSSFRFWRARQAETELYEQARALAAECAIDASLLHTQAGVLPHGEQRKVEFALALASRPQVLLLDEPMAGMGPDETLRLTELIETMRGKATMLLVEHDMEAVFRLADRISVLVAGHIIATGTAAEIRDNEAVRQAYLGDDDTPVPTKVESHA